MHVILNTLLGSATREILEISVKRCKPLYQVLVQKGRAGVYRYRCKATITAGSHTPCHFITHEEHTHRRKYTPDVLAC